MILTIWDLILPPVYLFLILSIAFYIKNKHKGDISYKYYVPGLLIKFTGGIFLGLVYIFYYGGGDTTNYFESAVAMNNLLVQDPSCFFNVMFGKTDWESYSCFSNETGYPMYYGDPRAFFVVKLITPIVIISLQSYIVSTIILAWICYSGIWRLYKVFVNEFPALYKNMAIAILFIPSVVFWGSGILKDSITLAAIGWFTYGFYCFFIKKEFNVKWAICLVASAFLLLSIKPYILFALLPGSLIWLLNYSISGLENKFVKTVILPFIICIGGVGAILILRQLDESMGLYALDSVIDRAIVVQKDMKQDYYGGASFDIGDLDGSIAGMLAKAPWAIAAGLFRPYLWDVKSVIMLFSALENTYILFLTLYLLMKLKVFGVFSLIQEHPMLLFSMLFSLFFAFSVGISISNFGSLVRLKIPAIPFFVAGLFILKYLYTRRNIRGAASS